MSSLQVSGGCGLSQDWSRGICRPGMCRLSCERDVIPVLGLVIRPACRTHVGERTRPWANPGAEVFVRSRQRVTPGLPDRPRSQK